MVTLNYKSFYEAFKQGVVDNGFTQVAEILFRPLLAEHAILDENDVPYEVNNQNASKWGNGLSPIPREIREVAGTDDSLKKSIDYFEKSVIPCVISDALEDELMEAMVKLVKECDLNENKKEVLLSFYEQKKYGEFLARVFQRALLGNNKVKKNSLNDKAMDTISEFDHLISGVYKKPPIIVPEDIQDDEMEYVSQLFQAYGQTTGMHVDCPEDLSLHYKEHFDFQRKNYYSAEIIHRRIRDSIRKDEEDCFYLLKDEIETGITIAASPLAHYRNPVERVDAITDKAQSVILSDNVDNIFYHWIDGAAKMGVCHMLVNDFRLRWAVTDGNQIV